MFPDAQIPLQGFGQFQQPTNAGNLMQMQTPDLLKNLLMWKLLLKKRSGSQPAAGAQNSSGIPSVNSTIRYNQSDPSENSDDVLHSLLLTGLR